MFEIANRLKIDPNKHTNHRRPHTTLNIKGKTFIDLNALHEMVVVIQETDFLKRTKGERTPVTLKFS
jgi:hypothetical protein